MGFPIKRSNRAFEIFTDQDVSFGVSSGVSPYGLSTSCFLRLPGELWHTLCLPACPHSLCLLCPSRASFKAQLSPLPKPLHYG